MPLKGGPTPVGSGTGTVLFLCVLGETVVKSIGDRQYRIHLSYFYVELVPRGSRLLELPLLSRQPLLQDETRP